MGRGLRSGAPLLLDTFRHAMPLLSARAPKYTPQYQSHVSLLADAPPRRQGVSRCPQVASTKTKAVDGVSLICEAGYPDDLQPGSVSFV